jgi:cathepsin B
MKCYYTLSSSFGCFWSVSVLYISGSDAYSIENDVESIQQEIMTNGPVEGAFTVFEDFLQYKSGTFICIYSMLSCL